MARTHLIIYYRRAFSDEEARRARHNHVLWLIRNAPQAGVLAEPYGEIDPPFDVHEYGPRLAIASARRKGGRTGVL